MRTDIHRPIAINPADYEFVALCGGQYPMPSEVQVFNAHRQRTGGAMSNHEHGGSCYVCGAHAIYRAIFYHATSNSYIATGMDCAEKLEMGNAARFRTFRKFVADARERKAGLAKAELLLNERGLAAAWLLYVANEAGEFRDGMQHEESTIISVVDSIIKYGRISDKQAEYIRALLARIPERAERKAAQDAKRAEEQANAQDCPNGRATIRGTVLKTEYRETQYGETLKMLVKSDDGWKCWGSVPSCLQYFELPNGDEQRGLKNGDVIEFSANFERSRDDSKFGFFKRPTKAQFISSKIS